MDLKISSPQHIFLNELKTKFRAYIGGFGSGKTYVSCTDQILFAIKNHGTTQGYFGPSYGSIKDIYWPTMEEAAEKFGIDVLVKRADKELILLRGNQAIGNIICRSMDNPESIVGFKISRASVDEIDTLKKDKAERAWNKIIARMRLIVPGEVNGIGLTCTPEGFGFAYERFKKNPTESYSMVQASTYENEEFLPPDYIDSLIETYPENLVRAYVMGEFVNLTSGSVYYAFDRSRHNTHWVAAPREPLHIGMDFNVGDMCAVAHVIRDKTAAAVGEFMGLRDTPDMCEAIKEACPGRKIFVYPDATGKDATSKSASVSDLSILKSAGFIIRAKIKNPRIKDRVACVNAGFEKGYYFVNLDKCQEYAEVLEQQPYNKATGQPLKDGHLDNRVDGAGYFMSHQFPLKKPSFKTKAVGGY